MKSYIIAIKYSLYQILIILYNNRKNNKTFFKQIIRILNKTYTFFAGSQVFNCKIHKIF
jgi:hypothetical protein